MASPESTGAYKNFAHFMFGGDNPVISQERLHGIKQEQHAREERNMIEFITRGKSSAHFNPKRIELLIIVRESCDAFLMILSVYCITASPFFLIYDHDKNNPLLKYSVGLASGLIGLFNVFRNILSEEIDKESGATPMIDKKLTANLKQQFRQNLIHTILIMIFPNDILDAIPICGGGHSQLAYDIPLIVDVNMLAHLVQLYKFYFIGRYFVAQSIFYSHSALRICSIYNALHDWMFVVKCRMHKRPVLFLMILLAAVVYGFAYALYITEHVMLDRLGKPVNIDGFLTSVWVVVATITTVGYGDIAPRTLLGRLITMVAALGGMVLFSLMTNSLTKELLLTSNEALSYGVIRKLEMQAAKETNSARLIAQMARLSTNPQGSRGRSPERKKRLGSKLDQLLQEKRSLERMRETFELDTHDLVQQTKFEIASKSVVEIRVLLSAIYEAALVRKILENNNNPEAARPSSHSV